MKEIIRQAIESAIGRTPWPLLFRLGGLRTVSVYYHKAHDLDPPYFLNSYRVKSPKEFESDLDYLLKRLKPLSLEELLRAESVSDLPQNAFFLSFDDGYRELAEVIAPILIRKGVPAAFFVCSSLLDNSNWLFEDQIALILTRIQKQPEILRHCEENCLKPIGLTFETMKRTRVPPVDAIRILGAELKIDWQKDLDIHRPYLTSEQVRWLLQHGFSIGAHGVDHRVFESMTEDEQFAQIAESCEFFSSRFSLPYRIFAFPYGEFGVGRNLFRRVIENRAADRLFGTRGLMRDEFEPHVWQRLWCEDHDVTFQAHLRRHLGASVLRYWRGKNFVRRRDPLQ